jgi:hypothetical protein
LTESDRQINDSIYQELGQINPINQINAIILAAVRYQFDLTNAENPLREFKALSEHGGKIEDYQPIDNQLKNRMNTNKLQISGPIISKVFNPKLPRAIYHSQILVALAHSYGYSKEEISVDDPYYLLSLATLTDHFYQGLPDKLLSDQTPIDLDSIQDLRHWEYLSYGSSETGYRIIKCSELDGLFRNYKYFKYPKLDRHDPEVYSTQAIKRLLILLLRPLNEEPPDSAEFRRNLARLINQIIQDNLALIPTERDLRDEYRRNDESRMYIDLLMNSFLDITMKMRGWTVVDQHNRPVPYPLSKTPVDNRVEVRVSDAIGEFDRLCGRNEKCSQLFLKYPLMEYRDGYVRSTDIDDGFNIQDRLNIVRNGESISSCIRITSNWFGATYSKMSLVLGREQVFDIRDLKHIG